MRRLVGVLGVVAGLAVPDAAQARPKPPEGRIIYVQKGSVWRAPLSILMARPPRARSKKKKKKNEVVEVPERLIKLAAGLRKITRLEAAGDGSALLLEFGRNVAWLDLTADPRPPPVFLPCRGRARLSPGGELVMCASRAGSGTSVYRLRPQLDGSLLAGFDPAATALADLRGERVVTIDHDALWSTSIAQPEQRTKVAPHVPIGALSIAPDGQRAVGRFRDGDSGDSLFGFRLDGQAARRKLGPGQAVAWSADSIWLAIFDGKTACAVRAVGGEYKCWDKYRPLALDRNGSWVLLARPPRGRMSLFLGRMAGPHPEKPLPLTLRGVSAAALVP
jgi:hypothetical protein